MESPTERAKRWLDPERNLRNLMTAGLFLLMYEFTRISIIENVRDFFSSGFRIEDKKLRRIQTAKDKVSYKERVTANHGNRLVASCLWLKEMEVLDDVDISSMKKLEASRNKVAHELHSLIFDSPEGVDVEMVRLLSEVLKKTDRFWGQIAVEVDPIWDGKRDEINYDGITSMRAMMGDYLIYLVENSEISPPEYEYPDL